MFSKQKQRSPKMNVISELWHEYIACVEMFTEADTIPKIKLNEFSTFFSKRANNELTPQECVDIPPFVHTKLFCLKIARHKRKRFEFCNFPLLPDSLCEICSGRSEGTGDRLSLMRPTQLDITGILDSVSSINEYTNMHRKNTISYS